MDENNWLSLPRGLHPGMDIAGFEVHGIHPETIPYFDGWAC